MTTDFQVLERDSPFPVGKYAIDIGWQYLEKWVADMRESYDLDLYPDFQREHVWTDEQRAAYVSYILRRGPGARTLYFACPNRDRAVDNVGPMVIVDGKQRLEAVRRFLRDELYVHGKLRSAWLGTLRMQGSFHVVVADLTRVDYLRWYLALNEGGTPHTEHELKRVACLLADAVSP